MATERQWLDTEHVWLVHKGGFTSAQLIPRGSTGNTTIPEGSIRIRLDNGDVLEVDEEDVEKVFFLLLFFLFCNP